MQHFCQNLKKLFFLNLAPLPRWASVYATTHLLFMVCFALYVDTLIFGIFPENPKEPDRIFAFFMFPSFALMYATPFIWFGILIATCIRTTSYVSLLATFLTVSFLGMVIWLMQVSMVIAYH